MQQQLTSQRTHISKHNPKDRNSGASQKIHPDTIYQQYNIFARIATHGREASKLTKIANVAA